MFYDLNVNLSDPIMQRAHIKTALEGNNSSLSLSVIDGYSGIAFNFEYTGALTDHHVRSI
jgi:hypothetical protein